LNDYGFGGRDLTTIVWRGNCIITEEIRRS
jgi:hypothetical protein